MVRQRAERANMFSVKDIGRICYSLSRILPNWGIPKLDG
jgi:hypothetical protein